jgi:hypothetical protein
MLLVRRAGARLAASSSSSSSAAAALPRLLLQRRQQEPQLSPSLPSRAVAASRALGVARYASPSPRGLASSTATATAKLSPADHHAVIQLIHRFDDYLNRGRHEELGVFFVEEESGNGSGSGTNGQVAVVRVLPPGAPKPVTHTGVPAIVAHFRACAPLARGNRHLLLNSIVEELPPQSSSSGGGEGEQAPRVGVRSARLLVSATNPPALRASGVVEDVLVKTAAGEWRILSRDLLMDPPPAAAAAAAAAAPPAA